METTATDPRIPLIDVSILDNTIEEALRVFAIMCINRMLAADGEWRRFTVEELRLFCRREDHENGIQNAASVWSTLVKMSKEGYFSYEHDP